MFDGVGTGVISNKVGAILSIRVTIAVDSQVTQVGLSKEKMKDQLFSNTCHVALNQVVQGIHQVSVAVTLQEVIFHGAGLYSISQVGI